MTNDLKDIVVFCGTMGVGKDCAANMIAEITDGARMAYADPLKEAVASLIGIPKTILYGTQADKEGYIAYGKSARHWLQWVGTEVGRNQIDTNIWVHRFADRALASERRIVICSDGRFKNEVEGLREHLVGKARVHAVRIKNPRVAVNLEHRSESEIYNLPDVFFDHIINNDGTLPELMGKLIHLAGLMGLPHKTNVL